MRTTTKHAIQAFNTNKSKTIGNTTVVANGAITGLYLFGNLIAEKNTVTGVTRITNAGYFTNTTKERLNGFAGVSIYQDKGKWYLNGVLWDGHWTKI